MHYPTIAELLASTKAQAREQQKLAQLQSVPSPQEGQDKVAADDRLVSTEAVLALCKEGRSLAELMKQAETASELTGQKVVTGPEQPVQKIDSEGTQTNPAPPGNKFNIGTTSATTGTGSTVTGTDQASQMMLGDGVTPKTADINELLDQIDPQMGGIQGASDGLTGVPQQQPAAEPGAVVQPSEVQVPSITLGDATDPETVPVKEPGADDLAKGGSLHAALRAVHERYTKAAELLNSLDKSAQDSIDQVHTQSGPMVNADGRPEAGSAAASKPSESAPPSTTAGVANISRQDTMGKAKQDAVPPVSSAAAAAAKAETEGVLDKVVKDQAPSEKAAAVRQLLKDVQPGSKLAEILQTRLAMIHKEAETDADATVEDVDQPTEGVNVEALLSGAADLGNTVGEAAEQPEPVLRNFWE